MYLRDEEFAWCMMCDGKFVEIARNYMHVVRLGITRSKKDERDGTGGGGLVLSRRLWIAGMADSMTR